MINKKINFLDLILSAKSNIREQLMTQQKILFNRVSLTNELLITQPDIVQSPEMLDKFHNDILDEEFRLAFGITQVIVVYLYKTEKTDFGPIYVPHDWNGQMKKILFMKKAIEDLKKHFIDETPLKRKKHLFLEMYERLLDGKLNKALEHFRFSTFIPEIKPDAKDEVGKLPISHNATNLFKDEMLIVTPLCLEQRTFLATVNTYIHKHNSLFGKIQREQFDDLKNWYLTTLGTLYECFLPIAHSISATNERIKHETTERVSALTYLLGHTFNKAFSTPILNRLDDIKRSHTRILQTNRPDKKIIKELNNANNYIMDIERIREILENTLSTLELFKKKEDGLQTYGLEDIVLSDLNKNLQMFALLLFNKRKESILRDSFLDRSAKDKIKKTSLNDWFTLDLFDKSDIIIRAHEALFLLHITNIIDNSIHYLNYRKSWEKKIKGIIKLSAQIFSTFEANDTVRVIISDNGYGMTSELCSSLNKLFSKLATRESSIFSEQIQDNLLSRVYSTGSGGRKGIALALSADYFSRITRISKSGETLDCGKIHVDSKVGKGTTFTITFPVKPEQQIIFT
jgi:signal transduction histidine kinase